MGLVESASMTGAGAAVECLVREGVRCAFGYPGAMILPFYQALCGSGIRHVLTRSEQGAGHAASGYARITGRPGICVSTSGPGATNLFTAIATAYSDSIPIIAITGQVASYKLGRDVFQEVDTTGAAQPFTKYTYLVKSARDIGRVFKEAFHICSTGRRGPVLIDLPIDVQEETAEIHFPENVDIRGYKPTYAGNALQVKRVAEAIGDAQRPLLCLGGGIFLSGAERAAREFSERINLPVVTTLMGVGALHKDHPLYFGMVGQSGDGVANYALSQSDLLILIGARVGDRAINRPSGLAGAIIVHVDIDPAEIGKNVGTTLPIVGDAAHVINQLSERVTGGSWPQWLASLEAKRNEEKIGAGSRAAVRAAGSCDSCDSTVEPKMFIRELSKLLPDDIVYIADVGQNQIWSAKNLVTRGRFLTTGGMGTMGYSLPAAIGAKLACPEKTVLAAFGDGAFQMSFNELATMQNMGIAIKMILFNNGSLGLVRELQIKNGLDCFAVDVSGYPDYGMIAAAYGVAHRRADNLDAALEGAREMLSRDGPFLLECVVDPEVMSS